MDFSDQQPKVPRMDPPIARQRPKKSGRVKGDARSLKRKREVDDHEKLQTAVAELVIAIQCIR
jgi:hypothetical protein